MDQGLKKYSRMDLLQLLVEATEANESLSAENNELRRAVHMTREQLRQQQQQQRPLQATKVGSIAEAALEANGYFEAAQRSADEYLREIKRLRDQVAANSGAQLQSANGQTRAIANDQMQAQVRAQVKAQVEHYRQQLQDQMQQQLNKQRDQMQAQLRAHQAQLQALHLDAPSVDQAQEAKKQADLIISQANAQAQAMMANARSKSEEVIADANKQAREIVAQANRRADVLIEAAEKNAEQRQTGPLNRKGRHVKMATAGA